MDEPKKYKLRNQKEVAGKPFAIMRDGVLPTYMRFDETERRSQMGRFKNNQFQIYSRDVGGWVDKQYNHDDGWRKQYMRMIMFDKEYEFENVWDKETKSARTIKTQIVEVPFGSPVEQAFQTFLETEKKRSGNPLHHFHTIRIERIGSRPIDVRYHHEYVREMTSEEAQAFDAKLAQSTSEGGQSSPSPSSQRRLTTPPTEKPKAFELHINAKPDNEEEQLKHVQQVVDGIKMATQNIAKEHLIDYRGSMRNQIESYFKNNNVTIMTPDEVLEKYIFNS